MSCMKNQTSHACRQGFTLIEISIVLVIIGLLVGGILAGREMVRQAEIRKQIQQIERYNTAVNAFVGKYDCMPGDCEKALELGVGDAIEAPQGDGSGEIDYWDEAITMWYHLNRAGMYEYSVPLDANLATPGIHTPTLVLASDTKSYDTNPSVTYRGYNTAGGVWLAAQSSLGMAANPNPSMMRVWMMISTLADGTFFSPVYSGVYKANIAFQIDSKLDDGWPRTGSVMAHSNMPIYMHTTNIFLLSSTGSAADSCVRIPVLPARPYYNVVSATADAPGDGRRCTMLIKASF